MIISKINLTNYRNIAQMELLPCENVNVIYGDNAQGKTNILEAIWLFTGLGGFRSSKLSECLRIGSDTAKIEIVCKDNYLNKADILFSKGQKRIVYNSIEFNSFSKVMGQFLAVVFSPSHMAVLKDGPKARRKMLDSIICQVKPQYADYLENYEKILHQRNCLIKNYKSYNNLDQIVEPWNVQLAKMGTAVTVYRNDYVKMLDKYASEIHSDFSSQKEILECRYISSVFSDEFADKYEDKYIKIYEEKLSKNLENDIQNGFTSIGVHRDDVDFNINSLSVKTYGSQGQQRSCIISVKLAEAQIIKDITNQMPVILLDDVMSELDTGRQSYLLNQLKDKQVFITCCDPKNIIEMKNGSIFKIEQGSLVEKTTND